MTVIFAKVTAAAWEEKSLCFQVLACSLQQKQLRTSRALDDEDEKAFHRGKPCFLEEFISSFSAWLQMKVSTQRIIKRLEISHQNCVYLEMKSVCCLSFPSLAKKPTFELGILQNL